MFHPSDCRSVSDLCLKRLYVCCRPPGSNGHQMPAGNICSTLVPREFFTLLIAVLFQTSASNGSTCAVDLRELLIAVLFQTSASNGSTCAVDLREATDSKCLLEKCSSFVWLHRVFWSSVVDGAMLRTICKGLLLVRVNKVTEDCNITSVKQRAILPASCGLSRNPLTRLHNVYGRSMRTILYTLRDPHSRPSTSKADEPDVSFIVRFPLSPTYPNGFLSHAGVLPVARGGRRQVQDVMEAIVPAYGEKGIKTESVYKAYSVIIMDSRIGVPAPWSSTAFP
ncbi:uncharacterized protein EMH_0038550 [Eimeria mitis]|uniref:Uncharacterized protein n=1 Tax=Eimeria mitis TaxID=44415 RepID=U6JTS1_9EIME|nr:uncharacterized protein EMH_0038550 [Eimeria mitis]CDJ28186.1 hypothetical protein, conserved [Eimeria mitis]